MKQFKAISWIDRIYNVLFKPKVTIRKVDSTITKRVKYLDDSLGRLMTKTEKVPFNSSINSNLSYTDFCLENLIEIGAVNSLKPTTMAGCKFESLRNIESHLASLSADTNNK